AQTADAEAAANAEVPTSYSSDSSASSSESARPAAPASEGTLASDEALAALREKLTGN
ncbi:MAG TPA: 30S ribosomal protein S1, partial [Phycicoccus elongatus]|nr:30S ribosomal protein S1 [Phycicoccus elongatus]